MRLVLEVVALAVICMTLAACDDDGAGAPTATSTPPLRTTDLRIGDAVFFVEVARTAEERALGLSGRTSLAGNAGMLFDLGATRLPSFTMRGMLLPLDVVWIDEGMRVHSIETGIPPPAATGGDPRTFRPMEAVRYVLELNAGAVEANGIERGDIVEFELP